jgi:hypothetical protein
MKFKIGDIIVRTKDRKDWKHIMTALKILSIDYYAAHSFYLIEFIDENDKLQRRKIDISMVTRICEISPYKSHHIIYGD